MDTPTTDKAITSYIHCAACMRELPDDESPESYARLSIGITEGGIQVWCVRHDINVAHLSPDELAEFIAERSGDCERCGSAHPHSHGRRGRHTKHPAPSRKAANVGIGRSTQNDAIVIELTDARGQTLAYAGMTPDVAEGVIDNIRDSISRLRR